MEDIIKISLVISFSAVKDNTIIVHVNVTNYGIKKL